METIGSTAPTGGGGGGGGPSASSSSSSTASVPTVPVAVAAPSRGLSVETDASTSSNAYPTGVVVDRGGQTQQRHHHHHGHSYHIRQGSLEANTTSPVGRDSVGGAHTEVELKFPDRVEEYEVAGTLFKKRGGWGKHLGWRPRAFTLYQGFMCYYEAEDLKDVDRYKPRGWINLNNKEEPIAFHVTTHKSHDHPPTEFVFQLVGPYGDAYKWKMGALNKEEYDKWVAAISHYVGAPVNPRATLDVSRREMNDGLGGSVGGGSGGEGDMGSPVGPFAAGRHHKKGRGSPSNGRAEGGGSQGGGHSVPHWQKEDLFEPIAVLVFMNAAFYWGRLVSWGAFWLIIFLTNIVLMNVVLRKASIGNGDGSSSTSKSRSRRGRSLGGSTHEGDPASPPKVPSKFPPIGSTVEPALKVIGGGGVNDFPSHSWTDGFAPNFKVRMGPNYRSTGKKEASGPQLYQLLHLDIYKTPCKISNIATILPSLPTVPNLELPGGINVPPLFIVNCQLPSEPPVLLNMADDGPGYNVIFYFGLKPETAQALKDLSTAPPAVKLLDDYFRIAVDSPEYRGRFKAMAQVPDIKELGLPGFIEKYNGKPVLITKSGTLYKGPNYAEMDINVHRFGFPAKRGLYYLQEKFKDIIFEVGFTVEGRDDSELPEIMLGVGQFNKIDVKKAFELVY